MRNKLSKPVFAEVFAEIAVNGDALESKAETILALLKSSSIKDEKSFSKAAREAYAANGWYTGRGRPPGGGKGFAGRARVPATIKQYVSLVRAAFRLEVDGRAMKSFTALRKAVAEARAAQRAQATPKDPNLAGVQISKSDTLLDAPFHDLIAIYDNLQTPRQKKVFLQKVKDLIAEFRSLPKLQLLKAA